MWNIGRVSDSTQSSPWGTPLGTNMTLVLENVSLSAPRVSETVPPSSSGASLSLPMKMSSSSESCVCRGAPRLGAFSQQVCAKIWLELKLSSSQTICERASAGSVSKPAAPTGLQA